MHYVTIHTDGSCLGNPGPGGWAAILHAPDLQLEKEYSGGYALTTNNRMEIMAVLEALRALKMPCLVDLYSDSQYVCNAVQKGWLAAWRKNSWRKADKKPVKNRDLWEALYPLLARHQITLHWLKGHAGHPENERCDLLARAAAQQPGLPADPGLSQDS